MTLSLAVHTATSLLPIFVEYSMVIVRYPEGDVRDTAAKGGICPDDLPECSGKEIQERMFLFFHSGSDRT